MRKKRTSMRKIKEILRLSLKEKFGQRKIAQSTGVGKTTIQEIISNNSFLVSNPRGDS